MRNERVGDLFLVPFQREDLSEVASEINPPYAIKKADVLTPAFVSNAAKHSQTVAPAFTFE
ncbi:conserved hypothetical protein [Vibrio chagasii]|nr:conserved hypothetical protein [Vibrio chagasii]CAH6916557.1 conserved hypothetical protein [Vibrio chagasii]